MGRKRTNCVYKFYSIDKATKRYKCLVCHRELKYVHGGNMLKHMMQHKDVYKKVLELNASLKNGENVDGIKTESSETEETNERLDPLDIEFLDESELSEDPRTEVEDPPSEKSVCKPTEYDSKAGLSTSRGNEYMEMKQALKREAKKSTETTCNSQQNDPNEVYAKYVSTKLHSIAAANPTQRMLAERIINETLFKAEMGLLTL